MENAKWTWNIYPMYRHLPFIQDHAAVTGRIKLLCQSFLPPLVGLQTRRLWCSTARWDMRPADVFTVSGRALKEAFRIHPFETISNLKAPNPTSHLTQPAASSDVVDVVDGNRPGWTFQLQTKAGADFRPTIS